MSTCTTAMMVEARVLSDVWKLEHTRRRRIHQESYDCYNFALQVCPEAAQAIYWILGQQFADTCLAFNVWQGWQNRQPALQEGIPEKSWPRE